MANASKSFKQNLIDKANARIVIYVGTAVFVLIFSLVATKTLVGQARYQNKVIDAKRTAVKQLRENVVAADKLKTSYDAFTGSSTNVLGGSANALGPKDGNNAKLVLDALPSAYDFPGLTTSLEALAGTQQVRISSITGVDDEVAQSANQSSAKPQAVPMPFVITTIGNYDGAKGVVDAFEKSIRPMQVQILDLSGTKDELTLTITAQTYYQPAKSLKMTKTVVK